MKIFDWQTFWEEHPRKQLLIDNVKWANLRPNTYDYEKSFQEINKTLSFQKTDKVLEVGCGTGEMLPYLTKITPARQVAAIDLSQTMIDKAMVNNPEVTVTKSPAHRIQFLDEEFDKVFSTGVIQHIPTPFFEASINEMLRVTKMGGFVFVGDVLVKADPAAEVFTYPKEVWSKFGSVSFSESGFEGRMNVLIKKTKRSGSTLDNAKDKIWGVMK
jgi:ubiquinone/menaquinone biosynthesis C-methylase UbiE